MSTILIGTEVHAPRSISIGSHSVVGRHCLLDGRGGLSIGRSVNISSYSLLITATHDAYDQDLSGSTAPIEIGDRAWIASGVKILAGVTIGEGAVVAAGAVVGTDVEPYTVVGGVPAKEIGRRPRSADDEAGYGALERGYRPNYI
jgi:acetyltransferase-like isoleucine patch superfamily enzyme